MPLLAVDFVRGIVLWICDQIIESEPLLAGSDGLVPMGESCMQSRSSYAISISKPNKIMAPMTPAFLQEHLIAGDKRATGGQLDEGED